MTIDTAVGHVKRTRDGTFDGGWLTLLTFVVAVAILGVFAVLVGNAVSDVEFPAWVGPVAGVGKFGLIAGFTVVLLRFEGVRPVELGLSKGHLGIALVIGAGVWVALNLIGAGLAAAAGAPWGLAVLLDQPTRWPALPAPLVVSLAFDVFVVALVEEFVFRGYLQSKLLACLGDTSWWQVGGGILGASLLFGIMHAPGAIVGGASAGGVLFVVAFLSFTGLAFGVLYELTHNIYFVAILHSIGNTWFLVADVWSLPGAALLAWLAGLVLVYAVVTAVCRRWGRSSSRRTVREPLSSST